MYIPSTIIQLMPFIIFISSIWFLLKIRNNRELLILKTFGYSNLRLFSILAVTAFILMGNLNNLKPCDIKYG